MAAESEHLLETLAHQSGCLNLSDLCLPEVLVRLPALLEEVQPEDFPLCEWNGAVDFLLQKPLYFPTGEAAKQYLLRRLS